MWILSCGQPGVMMEEEQTQVEIDTVREGSFVSPSDTIPLAILYDAEYVFPDKLEIFLRSAEGEVLASETVDAVELAEQTLPPLSLPELETGLYVLDFLLYEGEEVIREKQIEFFYVSGSYSIQGISSYPPVITPGSAAVFQARLEFPGESDPYLVWKMGEKTIAAGYVSEGGDSIQWEAPDVEGVYSIRMDVFPVGPLTGREFRFASERSMSTEVFVTSVSSEGKYELGPSGSYYTLFHFRGNTADDSDNGALRRVNTVGTPELALRGSLFGYYLEGTSGFTVSENLLPESAGRLAPFSVESRMLMDSPEQGGDIFTVSSASTGSLFRMYLGEDSRLSL